MTLQEIQDELAHLTDVRVRLRPRTGIRKDWSGLREKILKDGKRAARDRIQEMQSNEVQIADGHVWISILDRPDCGHKALEIARVILNGERIIATTHGCKTQIGLAYVIADCGPIPQTVAKLQKASGLVADLRNVASKEEMSEEGESAFDEIADKIDGILEEIIRIGR